MHHIDIPTAGGLRSLAGHRAPASVSLFLRTTPITQDTEQSRIEFGNLAREALDQIGSEIISKGEKVSLEELLSDIEADEDFWAHQSESLAVYATPYNIKTFRLPNHLKSGVQVSDRFHLPPLMRAVTFPHSATILVLGKGSNRVIEMAGNRPAGEIVLSEMPKDVASFVRKTSISGRAPKGRLQGSEGQKVHMLAYARQVNRALRPYLEGQDIPLILLANDPLRSIFLSVCTYDNVLKDGPASVSDESSNEEVSAASRELIDAHYASEIASVLDRYHQRSAFRRATSKVTDIAKSSTFGGVDTLLINMDETLPGSIDEESGRVAYGAEGAETYDVLSEIACRALLTGAKILSVRQDDLPESEPIAALLRHPV